MTHALRTSGRAGVTCRRNSTRFPGLSLELNAPFLTFRHGRTCEVFDLAGGSPLLLASSRETYRDLERHAHVFAVATAYAEALTGSKCKPARA